ncbi:hypothetical protein EON65_47590 [archaeon]|nr:MAG: hypothetical protein EON65_47590 [archaeon]
MNSVVARPIRALLVYLFYVFLFSGLVNSNLGHSRRPSLQNRLKDHEYSIYNMFSSTDEDNNGDRPKALTKEKEELYEAYNLLHTLAQVWSIIVHMYPGNPAFILYLLIF